MHRWEAGAGTGGQLGVLGAFVIVAMLAGLAILLIGDVFTSAPVPTTLPTATASVATPSSPAPFEVTIDRPGATVIARSYFMAHSVGPDESLYRVRIVSIRPSLADVHGSPGWTVVVTGLVRGPMQADRSATMWILVDARTGTVTLLSLA